MILKQFFEPHLAQQSFLVGCPVTGDAIVIDPNRRIEHYIEGARHEGLRISAVTETHIHADFVSGALALAREVGATLYVSAEGGPDWQYSFAHARHVRTLRHGDGVRVGQVRIEALHTPGHTPEHLTFVAVDEASSAQPRCAFTGDFIFAGDVGRPDLLEKAVGQAGTMDAAARQLFASLRAFTAQPDGLVLFPGHGAGSACGKHASGVPVTSVGYEREANWAFRTTEESAFVREVLKDQTDPPRYFAEMKRLNRAGAPPARPLNLPPVGAAALDDLVTAHAQLLDVRHDAAAGFLPGSILLPLTPGFLTRAGSVLRYAMPVYAVAGSEVEARSAAEALALIGIDDVRGWILPHAIARYRTGGDVLERVAHLDVSTALERQVEGHMLLDVRSTPEWDAGHIPLAEHAPLARMLDLVHNRDRDIPVIVYCQTGARSIVAASVLRRIGFTHVFNLKGGFAAYQAGCALAASAPERGMEITR